MMNYQQSLKTSLKSSLIILKLIIPIYIIADILFFYNLLSYISFLFEPITSFLDLPPEAALSIVSGMLLNLYAAIAFAAPLDLSPKEWTILAVYLGIAHALVVETVIMQKIGISKTYSLLLRIGVGLFVGFLTTLLPDSFFSQAHVQNNFEQENFESIFALLQNSFIEAFILAFEVILLITALIFILDYIKSLKIIQEYSNKVNSAFSISIGVILGITYGAGILINEYEKNTLDKKEIFFIGTFLMICHAIIEDTLLFVIFGANLWVIVSLRVFFAFAFAYALTRRLR
ncbi:MAG TPA: nucleoside recognition protein [Sulfurospirillum sp. UBA12182]|jgi:hypothetical protein|nr:MAG TPA: nucleoside recognition protein [Sulfurospirillum sp. UBA12182]